MRTKKYFFTLIILVLCLFSLAGCDKNRQTAPNRNDSSVRHDGPPRDNTPSVLVPEASGVSVLQDSNSAVTIDISNTSEGYVMVKYEGSASKVKLHITTPEGTPYPYILTLNGGSETFPLTGGDGSYKLEVFENVRDDLYSILLSETIEVSISDEFKPFLYPNQYTWFSAESKTVQKAAELSENTYSDLDVVSNIYNYVIDNVTYDDELAKHVQSDYLPDNDRTLVSGTGICFDYAALMTAMLRSQHIPTKLEIGYSGEIYHAWISTYIKDVGWVNNIIQFDGVNWSLMDPTLAANKNNSDEAVKEYIGDGSHYILKYSR